MTRENSEFDDISLEQAEHEHSLHSLTFEVSQEEAFSVPSDIQDVIHNSYARSTASKRHPAHEKSAISYQPETTPDSPNASQPEKIEAKAAPPNWIQELYNTHSFSLGERFSVYMSAQLKRAILDEAKEKGTTPTTTIRMALLKTFPDAIDTVYPDQIRYELHRQKYENGQIDNLDWSSKLAERFYTSTEKEEKTQISFELPKKLADFLHEKSGLSTSLLSTNELIATSLEYEFDVQDDMHLISDAPEVS